MGRGVEPTAAGLHLARAAGPLFEELAEVESAAEDLRSGRVGTLSMAYFTSAAMAWIPGVVAEVLAHHPDLRLDLRVQEFPNRRGGPRRHQVLVAEPDFTPPPGLPLPRPEHRAVRDRDPRGPPPRRARQHRQAEAGRRARIADDTAESWCRRLTERATVSAGFVPQYSVQTNGHPTAIAFVAAGIGVAAMPTLCAVDLAPGSSPCRSPTRRRRAPST